MRTTARNGKVVACMAVDRRPHADDHGQGKIIRMDVDGDQPHRSRHAGRAGDPHRRRRQGGLGDPHGEDDDVDGLDSSEAAPTDAPGPADEGRRESPIRRTQSKEEPSMKFFIDTANVDEIREAASLGSSTA